MFKILVIILVKSLPPAEDADVEASELRANLLSLP
jgi:hypothetical protein